MNCKNSLFRLAQRTSRNFTISATTSQKTNHYDSLGITKAATQADVKSAYYKLSKVYHPDRNMGNEEHSKKFKDISAAYEVLGNVKLRKMYDKGLYGGDSGISYTPDDPLHNFYKSRDSRSRPPAPTGSTPIYDFDEWSKMHYGATFQRSQEVKKRRQRVERMRVQHENNIKHERIFGVMVVLSVICMYLLNRENQKYDTVNVGGSIPVIVKKEKDED